MTVLAPVTASCPTVVLESAELMAKYTPLRCRGAGTEQAILNVQLGKKAAASLRLCFQSVQAEAVVASCEADLLGSIDHEVKEPTLNANVGKTSPANIWT